MNEFITKVTLTLKPTQRISPNEWKMHFKQKPKIVLKQDVCFYTDSVLLALQAFTMDEVESFIVEYNRA